MKVLKIIASGVAVLLVVVAIAAPIGPMPGFFIGGTPGATPAAWPDTSGTHEIKLRVPGTIPRVVIIWVVDVAGELYVVGSPGSGWVTKIGAGSPVDMRLGEATYSLRAAPVTEGWMPVLEAYVAKYEPDYPDIIAGIPSMDEAEGQFAVFHLERK
jgi:hypothetical protein